MRNDGNGTKRPPKLATLPVISTPQAMHSEPCTSIDEFPASKVGLRAEKLDMVAVEVSGYSPSLARNDVIGLLGGFEIAADFKMPSTTKFAYPLRTIIWINGHDEADRAVRELDGMVVRGRRVRVTKVDQASYEYDENAAKENVGQVKTQKHEEEKAGDEVVLDEMADELKIAIIRKSSSISLPHSRI